MLGVILSNWSTNDTDRYLPSTEIIRPIYIYRLRIRVHLRQIYIDKQIGSRPILSIKRSVTIDTMLNFDSDSDGTCKQTLTSFNPILTIKIGDPLWRVWLLMHVMAYLHWRGQTWIRIQTRDSKSHGYICRNIHTAWSQIPILTANYRNWIRVELRSEYMSGNVIKA